MLRLLPIVLLITSCTFGGDRQIDSPSCEDFVRDMVREQAGDKNIILSCVPKLRINPYIVEVDHFQYDNTCKLSVRLGRRFYFTQSHKEMVKSKIIGEIEKCED